MKLFHCILTALLAYIVLVWAEQDKYPKQPITSTTLHPGDLVLTRNRALLNLTTLVTGSCYSHVGIVMDNSTIVHKTKDDHFTLSFVTLEELKESNHYSLISILPIRTPVNSQRLKRIVEKYINMPFESNISELFRAAIDNLPFSKNHRNLHQLFCSEFVAQVLQDLNLLSTSQPSNEYVPVDFLSLPIYNPLRVVYRLSFTGLLLGTLPK